MVALVWRQEPVAARACGLVSLEPTRMTLRRTGRQEYKRQTPAEFQKPEDAQLYMDLQKDLHKKEKKLKLKEVLRSGNCILKKLRSCREDETEDGALYFFCKGEGMTSIEPTAGAINILCVFSESGLMLLALDTNQIPSYYLPALGPAPEWCSYMENLMEPLIRNCLRLIGVLQPVFLKTRN